MPQKSSFLLLNIIEDINIISANLLFKNTCSYVNVYLRESVSGMDIDFAQPCSQSPKINIQKLYCSKMDKSSFLADIGKIVAGLKNVDAAYIFGSFLERGIQRYRYSISPIRRT
jgi:hypothetical protein